MTLFKPFTNEAKDIVPAIEESRLLELFQFENPDFFHLSTDVSLDDNSTTPLEGILRAVESVSAKHFAVNTPTKINKLYFGAEECGSFIMGAHYTAPFRDGTQERFAMIIAHMHNKEDDPDFGSAAPFFVMSGYYAQDEETKKPVVVIQEAVCRVRTINDREAITKASNLESLMASLCYADEAFRAIAVGDSLDIDDYQSWIDEQNFPYVKERIEILAARDEAGLREELRLGSEEAITRQADEPPSFDKAIEKAVAGGSFYIQGSMRPS